MSENVFVIDHEIVSPIAVGKNEVIENIRSNFSADGLITSFDVSGLPFQNGAEIRTDLKPFYQDESEEIKTVCGHDRKLELLVTAYSLAKKRLEPLIEKLNPKRTGVILGIGAEVLPLKEFEPQMINFIEKKLNAVCELMVNVNDNKTKLNKIGNSYELYTHYLAEKFNALAFQQSILTACVSSTQAIAMAFDRIKYGQADVVIAGGTDSIINLIALVSFGKLGVIPESNKKSVCQPFDTNRNGTIAGEAAGFTILASEKFVRENGLRPIASILGYGNTLDAYKITAPDPSGIAMSKAISQALTSSKINPNQLDYYYAHGTGTAQNDGTELLAFRNALGDEAYKIPISSTKDRHGHAISAAGIQEFSILLELMKHSLIPGNMNLKNPINSELLLPKENQNQPINYALSSNFAFGGINTVLCVKNE